MTTLYSFGEFELDEARFQLRRAGCVVAVQPKVLRLLLHLVAQRERVVSYEELFSVLWPGERVGPASIKRAVIGARRALGESGDAQTSVRTARGFGYQFARPVRGQAHASPTLLGSLPSSALERLLAPLCAELVERVLQELRSPAYSAACSCGAPASQPQHGQQQQRAR